MTPPNAAARRLVAPRGNQPAIPSADLAVIINITNNRTGWGHFRRPLWGHGKRPLPQATRSSRAIGVLAICWAKKATRSSKSRV